MRLSATPMAALFDVEGTLVDCVSLQLESWRRVLATAGYQFTHADLQPYSGMDGAWMLERLLPSQTPEDRSALLEAQGRLYKEDFMPEARPFPAVCDLFEILKQAGVLIGIATTCQKGELGTYDRLLNVLHLTDAVVCGEMVEHGKPDPALIRTCLNQLGCKDPSGAIMIGDTPYDARAAMHIGVRAGGVSTGGFSERVLREAGCTVVYSQIREVASLWRQPARPHVRAAI